MNDFNAKVAVITGAASGIGRGLAERKAGGTVLAVQTDVSKAADVEALARRTLEVRASVLCPGFVNTRILDSERNRPTRPDSPVGAPH